MVEKKSIKEFQATGLLLIVNQILHIFGWAIVIENCEDSELSFMYPARVKFRGFDDKSVADAYIKVSEYMNENSETLLDESKN